MTIADSLRSTHAAAPPRRAAEVVESAEPTTAGGRLAQRVLRIPLLPKLVVADLIINLLSFWALGGVDPEYAVELMVVALFVTLVLNAAMVYWALLPLSALEATAAQVSGGDFAARVPPSFLADRNIARIGRTPNHLRRHKRRLHQRSPR